jgi:hypothetical protein
MRRLALVTLVTMLALPGAALARSRTFPARVVRATAQSLTVRRADGAIVRYVSPRVAAPTPERPLLAHVARATEAGRAAFSLQALEAGVTVLVDATRGGVTVTLPGPGASGQRAIGVVSVVAPDGFVLRLPDRTALRLHTSHRLSLRPCETASVTYHQDLALLVADRVQRLAGGRRARGCSALGAAGTIAAISPRGLMITTGDGRSLTFSAPRTTTGGFAVGDAVDVSYLRGRAIDVAYAERLARGTVTGAGDGDMSVIDSATGRLMSFASVAAPSIGAHVAIVYHRSAGRAVADVLYAQAG